MLDEPIAVLAPSPLVTVTIEEGTPGAPELHFHAGGQGVWVARMITALDCTAILCAPVGGEAGLVLRPLLESERIVLREVSTAGENGGYVHDRRGGERREIVATKSPVLTRHELDELYGTALGTAVECKTVVLTGPAREEIVPAEMYGRFAADAHANGVTVVADLSRAALRALTGGVHILKVAHDELVEAGFARSTGPADLAEGMRRLRDVAEIVVVSRAEEPALVLAGNELLEVEAPRMAALDHRGAGDSMCAALAVGARRRLPLHDTLRLAAAAGASNVTRRGLGTGRRRVIEALAPSVRIARVG